MLDRFIVLYGFMCIFFTLFDSLVLLLQEKESVDLSPNTWDAFFPIVKHFEMLCHTFFTQTSCLLSSFFLVHDCLQFFIVDDLSIKKKT